MTTKKLLYTFVFLLICFHSSGSALALGNPTDSVSVIPQPLNTKRLKGEFKLTSATIIQTDVSDARLLSIAQMLSDNIYSFTKQRLVIKKSSGKSQHNAIILTIDKQNQS